MNKEIAKQNKAIRRKKRVRAVVFGTSSKPRLSVNRSNRGLYVQIIDDSKSSTLVSISDKEIKNKDKGKIADAFLAGKKIAEKASIKNIQKVVFDKGEYKYHGRVKAVAEGAREGGLKF